MKKQYTLSGMSCGGCVNTVKQALLKIHGIIDAEVFLQPQSAVLTMSKPISTMELQTEIKKKGNYTIEENG